MAISTMNKRVLVTGAGGFIGSHLVEELIEQGAKVSCFVKYNSQNDYGMLEMLHERDLRKINIISGDINDPYAVLKACQHKDIVFHLASIIAIPYSYVHNADVLKTNIIGTLNVMNACLINKVKKVIHTSTSEVYGSANYVPIDENHPLQAQSPYSASKISADKLVESFYNSFNLPVITIRPFNTYGERQSARAIIPTIITQALTSKVIKLGSVYPKRDFTYVKDTVKGFIKAAESDCFGEVINLGTNTEISIKQLTHKIFKLTGRKASIKEDKIRIRPDKSEVDRLLADNRKAKKLLGWKPTWALEDGLRNTIDFVGWNLDKYKPDKYNI